MTDPKPVAVYSIAAVSKLTGVSCHALRVWERRYGFPTPRRSAAGHRRYESADVAVLRRVGARIRAGQPIRHAMEEARANHRSLSAEEEAIRSGLGTLEDRSAGLLRALLSGDEEEAERIHADVEQELRPGERVARVLEPALVEAGEAYFRGVCALGIERAASQYLLRKLAVALDEAKGANREPKGCVLVGCPQGDRHEGGPLLVGVALEAAGWRSIQLGGDLPTTDYQFAVDRWRPDALAVSFVLSRNVRRRFEELSRLRGAPIFVGGRSIVNYQSLASRHGLVPLAGRATPAVAELIARLEREGRG